MSIVVPAAAWLYPAWAVYLAAERGWGLDEQHRHINAVNRWNESMGNPADEDEISLTHPYNYLTEAEVERTGA